jgi:hypothetical protein
LALCDNLRMSPTDLVLVEGSLAEEEALPGNTRDSGSSKGTGFPSWGFWRVC